MTFPWVVVNFCGFTVIEKHTAAGLICTVEPALQEGLLAAKMGWGGGVSHDRWSLVTGSVTLKCTGRSFCQKHVVVKTGGLPWQWYLKKGFMCSYTVCFPSVEVPTGLCEVVYILKLPPYSTTSKFKTTHGTIRNRVLTVWWSYF